MNEENYSEWTKTALYEKAAELDIDGRSSMDHEELVAAIEKAESDEPDTSTADAAEDKYNEMADHPVEGEADVDSDEDSSNDPPLEEGSIPESVSDLNPGAALAGATMSETVGAKAPKGTEYPDDTPDEQKLESIDTKYSGKHIADLPLIPTGAAVKLAHNDHIPERFQGATAMVIDAPRYQCQGCDLSPRPHEHQPADTVFTVRTRDDTDTILNVTREGFEKVSPEGRVGILSHG